MIFTLNLLFPPVEFRDKDIEDVLMQAPEAWAYLAVRMKVSEAGHFALSVARAEREPGKGSGKNPTITDVAFEWKH